MNSLIRRSTAADLSAVIKWLKDEDEKSGTGFYCNQNIIIDAHSNGKMIVLVENDLPVAFLANGVSRDGILEVRKDHRGRGYGKALAKQGIQQAFADNEVCVLEIQCAPSTSTPFWERLGFKVHDANYASLILHRH